VLERRLGTKVFFFLALRRVLFGSQKEVVNEPQELDVGDLFSSFTDVSWGS
jgi:hypothetical protein